MRWSNQVSSNRVLTLIVVAYLALGGLYAAFTPAWQAPDEPAHYNYVRYLAENKRLPVLKAGDYPHDYLEQIKSEHFPPHMSIEPLRYEFWQPPLYYVLATPVYWLFGGALFPLRLLSVVFGLGVVLAAYAVGLALRPGDRTLALGTCALVAFVPMHLAIMASVNNDALAELLLALVMLRLIRVTRSTPEGEISSRSGYLAATGLLLGLGLITKATVYVAIPLGLAALLLIERRLRGLARPALALFGPALALAAPWYGRNIATYGWPDLLGTINHDAVVAGQLRTADYLAEVGWRAYVTNFFTTTFHSFWGQFGWMAVPMDRRVYLALGLLSALILTGLFVAAWRKRERLVGWLAGWKLVGLWLVLTSLMYIYYNFSLVQFQGRYLFPMLIPLGLLATLGLRKILSRPRAAIGAGVCGLATLLIGVLSGLSGDLDKWGLLIAGAATLGLVARRWLPPHLDGWVLAVPWAGLAGLSIYSLFFFVIPYLHP